MENVENPDPEPPSTSDTWEFLMNPWLIALIAAAAYYTYQNYLPKLRLPSGQDSSVTPLDEEKVRKMMEARDKQQVLSWPFKKIKVFLQVFFTGDVRQCSQRNGR